MRYLRMLSNAALAGALGASYVTLLVLQLNPAMGMRQTILGPTFLTFGLFYGVALTVIFYAAIIARQLLADEILSPGWISVRLLAWLSTATAGAVTLVMWLNLRGFRVALDPAAARRMAFGVVAMTIAAAALLTIAAMHYSFGRRGSRVSAGLLTGAVALSIIVPGALRGPAMTPVLPSAQLALGDFPAAAATPRLILLMLDGASLDYLSPAVAEGRLPNFGKILDNGAAMHLTTLRPTQPAPVWTAVATGKFPPQNGVRSAAMYRLDAEGDPIELLPDLCFSHALVPLGLLSEAPHASTALRAPPVWSILSRLGLSVNIVGWPVTYPAQPVRGSMISDRFHLSEGSSLPVAAKDVMFPPAMLARARVAAEEADLAPSVVTAADASQPPGESPGVPTARDAVYRRVAADLERYAPAAFTAVRYEGIDTVGHEYLRYAMPRAFGDVSAEELRRFGNVLERYYGFIDGEIGPVMASLRPEDVLLVVSGFGMEPVSLGKRILARLIGDPPLSGSHEGAPDGFLLAYGAPVIAAKLNLGSIVDVAPSILYFFGLPVGRDMDGFARTDIFTREFTAERPLTFIPSHQR